MGTKRIEWIDAAKGFGIILVIFGHTIALRYCQPVYVFHMPLFFLLSGLLFNADRYGGLGKMVKHKAKGLLRPYIILCTISFLVCMLIPEWRDNITTKKVLVDFYTSSTNVIQNSSLWFLPCMFFAFIITFHTSKVKTRSFSFIVLIIVAYAVTFQKPMLQHMKFWGGYYLPEYRLPFKIDSAFVAAVFLGIGARFKNFYLKVYLRNIWAIIIILVGSLTLCLYNGWSNVASLDFGIAYHAFYYPIALLTILSIVLLCKYICESQHKMAIAVKRFLMFYGENSLIIFGFQSLLIRLCLLLCNNTFGMHMQLYEDYPKKFQLSIFFVVTFLLCPFVVIAFKQLKKRGINVL